MKALLGMIALGVAFSSVPAAAAPWDYRPGLQGQDRRSVPRDARDHPGRDQRAVPRRDDRYDNRLSDEERRALRRDLDRANRELYRRNRQR